MDVQALEEGGVWRSNNTFVVGVARCVFWPHEEAGVRRGMEAVTGDH